MYIIDPVKRGVLTLVSAIQMTAIIIIVVCVCFGIFH